MIHAAHGERRARCGRLLVVITSTGFGGAEKIVEKVVTEIPREDFDPVVCSLHPVEEIGRAIEAAGIPVVSMGMPRGLRPTDLWPYAKHLAALIDELEIDLVHSFLYRANFLTRVGARMARRRPVICSGHHSVSPSPQGRVGMFMEALTHRLSDWCVPVSIPVRDRVVNRQKANPRRTVIIENGIDTAVFSPRNKATTRAELGVPEGRIVLGGVGRLSHVKAFDDLIEAVAIARDEGVDCELHLAGGGEDEAKLRAHASELMVEDYVRFLGMQSDLPPVYSAMDIFVLSSLDEASPTVILEAMGCACAIVSTRVGGALTMIEDEVTGILVEPRAPRQIADAIVRLADDPTLRKRLAANARERVVERFDVARMVENHASFYRAALAERHGLPALQAAAIEREDGSCPTASEAPDPEARSAAQG